MGWTGCPKSFTLLSILYSFSWLTSRVKMFLGNSNQGIAYLPKIAFQSELIAA